MKSRREEKVRGVKIEKEMRVLCACERMLLAAEEEEEAEEQEKEETVMTAEEE